MYKITLYFLDHTEDKPSKYTFKCADYDDSMIEDQKLLTIYNAEGKGSFDRKHKVYTKTYESKEDEISLTDTMVMEIHTIGGKEKRLIRVQRRRTPENTLHFKI